MDKQKNIDNAKAVFAKQNVKALFFTNDGQAFSEEGPAKVHQKELTGKVDGLHKVNNGSYQETAAEISEDTVTMDIEEVVADGAAPAKKGKKKEATEQ